MQDVGERPDPSAETTAAYPTTVMIAGIGWIVYGGLVLLSLALLLLAGFGVAAVGPPGGAAVVVMVVGGLVGGAYGHGCQSPQFSRYCCSAGISSRFCVSHSLARLTASCSRSRVSSPTNTWLRRKTKYVSKVSNRQ